MTSRRRFPFMRVIRRAIAAPVVAALIATMSLTMIVGGCASPWHNESADLDAQNSETALRIKAALIEEPTLAGAAIDVAFADGSARLTGFVETAEQRRTATRVARGQEGVSSVVNEIVVK